MSTTKTLHTAEDLLRVSARDKGRKRYELVRGELIEMAPAGPPHSRIASKLNSRLRIHVEPQDLGEVYGPDAGFRISSDPDTVRAPDVSYIAKGRLPDPEPPGFWPVVPDLVAEVVSPGDTAVEVQDKVDEYLRAGVRLVWVLYPEARTIYAYDSLEAARVLHAEDTLTGGSVLPGFSCPVRDIF